jgi:hypothetical protein
MLGALRPAVTIAAMIAVSVTSVSSIRSQSNPPPCQKTPELDRLWTAANQSLGIVPGRGIETVGDRAAVRWFGGRNWFPVDGRQHVLCGRLADWSLFNGAPFTPHERDLHPYIVPGDGFEDGEGFRHFVTDLPLSSRDNVRDCDNRSCLYGEVTTVPAVSSWLLDPGVPGSNDSGKFVGAASCMYGPWVMERVHGWLPEIHPVRQFWATEKGGSSDAMTLVLTQDSSNRYADRDKFKRFGPNDGPQWTARSLRETVGIAYELAANGRGALTMDKVIGFRDLPSPKPNIYSRTFGTASLQVSLPSWIPQGQSEACTIERQGQTIVRGIEWLRVSLSPPDESRQHEGAAVVLSLRRSGMTRPFPHEHLLTSSAPPPARAADRAEVPELTMEPIELKMLSERSFDDPLPGTAKTWALPETHQSWRLHGTQHLTTRVYYTGSTPQAQRAADELNHRIGRGQAPAVDVTWEFTATSLDPAGAPITVGPIAGPFQYGVTVTDGDAISSRGPALRDTGDLKARDEEGRWRSLVVVVPPQRVFGDFVPARVSPTLTLTATLRDAQGRSGTFEYAIHHYFPTFADVEHAREPPRTLLLAIATELKRRRTNLQTTTVDAIVTALARDWSDAAATHAVARRARIVRTFYLISVRDGDLEPTAFTELLRLAEQYAEVRWP